MRLAVFASGGGSNFQAIIDAVGSGRLDLEICLCVSNKEDAGAIERARKSGIPCLVEDPQSYSDQSEYESCLTDALASHGIDFIALAGYLRKIPSSVVNAFRHRMVNIHPALLPAHGGAGMYGQRVHKAVLAAGEGFSGATVHFVDEEYDTGAIILQDTVPVLPTDTPQALAERVLDVEHRLYPAALSLLSHSRVVVQDHRVRILENTPITQ
ncbi:MAG: formyltetrahydrofolate-dependent phosphoribosylglycinamide formyltransferase [Rhodothermales bacterium]|jgi:formyltetrahydrofolate-dependent phosphoribosylglycinamide formyltransferase